MENACDRQTAENEFDRWCEAMRIDMDMDGLDANDARDKALDKRTFVKAMMEGRLIVDEEGRAVFTPEGDDAKPLTFYKAKGSALAAMDKAKKTEDIGKIYKSMGEMTRTGAVNFSKMDVADTKICMAIATLFLA
jgi:hypothetical protein